VKLIAACLCIFGLMLAPAKAGEKSTPWAKSGEWDIMVDDSMGNGCFMLASWTRGEILRVGFDNSNNNKKGYVMIANTAWRSVEIGKEYDLTFKFDGDDPWSGTFRATKLGALTVLVVYFSKPELLKDFGAKQGLTVYYDGKFVTRLPLTGSYAAMQTLVDCQSKIDARASTPSDPFSRGGDRTVSDPFSGSGGRPATDPMALDPFSH
jgi:hypothetical protein